MANEVVLTYFRMYASKYPVHDLKQKVLSRGYPEADIDEAIDVLGLSEELQSAEVSLASSPTTQVDVSSEKSSVNWKKLILLGLGCFVGAGIVGFLLLYFLG